MLEVLSLQAYLEWYREPTLSVKIDFEDDEINYLLDSCSIDEITEIIDNHDLDAIDIYADHRLDLSTIREILMMSIERNCFRRDSTYRYYLNTTIKEKLMNINLKDKLRAHRPKSNLNSIISFFDIIHTELYDAYDALV